MAKFFIVVPTFNSAAFLDRCLHSLITMQPGKFNVRIHVQDGGSTDATAEIAARWADRGVSFQSEPDDGLYDALAKAAVYLHDDDIMTWLGTDDYLMPGTIGTATSIFDNVPHVNWITGRPFVGKDEGENLCLSPNEFYTRRALSAGEHDGRTRHFIMQEGTFWRASLWRSTGGIDRSFKYAGDWDLWRRFALHSPLYFIELPLARFTQREGQKSQNMDAYYAEIDAAAPCEASTDDIEYRLSRYHYAWPWNEERIDHAAMGPLPPQVETRRTNSWMRRIWPRPHEAAH